MEIEDLLKEITTNNKNQFSLSTTTSCKSFSLSLKDSGEIKFPLSLLHLKKLLTKGGPAPFGWKNKTIHDKSVRDCTEIEPSNFTINPKWNEALKEILVKTKKSLGLDDGTLEAHLYKMLIYEKNQFFKPHQDSEKLEGMIATLVVILPSIHKGGEISITHNDKKIKYKTDNKSQDIIQAIAFYSDCHHEVAPIKDGARVALTYNLVFKRETNGLPKTENKKMENWFLNYFSPNDQLAEKFIYLFDHQYTQKSLNFHSLKGNDFQRARTLISICQSLNYHCALALADLHEVWSCEMGYESDHYDSRRSRYNHYDEYDDEYDDDEDDDHSSSKDYALEDLVDEDVELKHLKFLPPELGVGPLAANKSKIKDLKIHSSELFMAIETKDFKPFSSEFEGWMGNYGNTLDRWYHRAGMIIWPKNYSSVFILKDTPGHYLKDLRASLKKAADHGNLDENFINNSKKDLAEIMNNGKHSDYQFRNLLSESKTFIDLIIVLNLINDKNLIEKYLNFTSRKELIEDEWEVICETAELNGEKWCKDFLRPWILDYNRKLDFKGISFCCQYVSTIKDSDFLSEFFFSIFDDFLNRQLDYAKNNLLLSTSKSTIKENENTLPLNILISFESLIALKESSHESIIKNLILKSQINLYNFTFGEKAYTDSYLQYLIFLKLNTPVMIKYLPEINFKKLKDDLLEKLNKKRTSTIRSENDWSMKSSINCKCDDCKTLVCFLANKNLNTLGLRMGKDRRKHLHNQIGRSEIELSHNTSRTGSPFTLNLVKLSSIFKKSKNEVDKIQVAIANLDTF